MSAMEGIGALHSSTALSKPICSFCAMAYIMISATAAAMTINKRAVGEERNVRAPWFIAVRTLRFGRRFLLPGSENAGR